MKVIRDVTVFAVGMMLGQLLAYFVLEVYFSKFQ